jgi:hypothetical protein
MLDEDYRRQARDFVYKADFTVKANRANYFPAQEKQIKDRQIHFYQLGIEAYSNIRVKTMADHRAIASTLRHIAITFFNWAGSLTEDVNASRYEYEQAGQYYLKSIHYFKNLPRLEDEEFRNLTELYVDLSDVCCHLLKHVDAEEALGNAILAFKEIKIKNSKELAIGDPVINFKVFYEHVQSETSTASYLSSTRFKNYQQILLGRREEQQMADMFDTVSMMEKPVMDMTALDSMMSGLGLSNNAMPSFVPVRLDNPVNDVDYRCISIEYLRLTQQHIQASNIFSTIITYRQALSALQSIQTKTQHDLATVDNIETQIRYLEKEQAESSRGIQPEASAANPLYSQNQQVAGSLISSLTMFGHQPARAAALAQKEAQASEFLGARGMF